MEPIAKELIRPGAIFQHYKGGMYMVVMQAKLEWNMEDAVVYQTVVESPNTPQGFVRPLAEFCDGRFQPRAV